MRASASASASRPSGGDDGVGDTLAWLKFVDAGRTDRPRDVDDDRLLRSSAAPRSVRRSDGGALATTSPAASARAASGNRDSVGATGVRSIHQAIPARTRTAPVAPRSRAGPRNRSHGTTVSVRVGIGATPGHSGSSPIDIDFIVGFGDHSLPPRLCAASAAAGRSGGMSVGSTLAGPDAQRCRLEQWRLSSLRYSSGTRVVRAHQLEDVDVLLSSLVVVLDAGATRSAWRRSRHSAARRGAAERQLRRHADPPTTARQGRRRGSTAVRRHPRADGHGRPAYRGVPQAAQPPSCSSPTAGLGVRPR